MTAQDALRDALTSSYGAGGESWRLVAMSDDGGIIPAGLPEPLVDAIIAAALPAEAPETDDLDAAWRAAEEALPEGWRLNLHGAVVGLYAACAYPGEQDHDDAMLRGYSVVVDTPDGPAAALLSLAATLRERAS